MQCEVGMACYVLAMCSNQDQAVHAARQSKNPDCGLQFSLLV